jgi:hypothetical protein
MHIDTPELTTQERIYQYYQDDNIQLSPCDEEIRKRWVTAHKLIIESGIRESAVITTLMKEYNIIERQAYRDIRNSASLFGNVQKASKSAYRYIITQWSILAFRNAEIRFDYRAMDRALGRIIKANNLDKIDPSYPDPSMIRIPKQTLYIEYEFLKSPQFKHLDKTVQEKLQQFHEKWFSMIPELGVTDYTDELIKKKKGEH